MKNKIFIGIDPGMGGGIAVIFPDNSMLPLSMPQTEKDISDQIKVLTNTKDAEYIAVIEKVNSMPGQGIVSAWKFSGNYHGVRMALICHGVPFIEVQPQKWQQEMGIPKRSKTETKVQHKNKLKAKAQQMRPEITVNLKTADAILIAEYCKRIHK